MITVCPNASCGQRYKVKPEVVGVMARCKKCSNVFQVTEYIEPKPMVDLDPGTQDESEDDDQGDQADPGRRRRTPREVMDEHIERIKQNVASLIPRLNHCHKNQQNESDTRLLINQLLQEMLGYKYEDIKTEQRIEGRRADYVLSINGQDALVIESKRIGASLKERQIFQATSYAAYAGIKWAVLTNAWVWQLYRVSTGEKIETDLIWTVDMMDGVTDQEAYWMYLISRHGLARKNLLEGIWKKVSAMCCDNIVSAILSEEVISKIRSVLVKQTGCRITDDELRSAIEENILQL